MSPTTPPPPYSSASSTRSSSSNKHKPASSKEDKEHTDRDKDKDSRDRDVKVRDKDHPPDADDVLSIKSQLSTRSSATASSTQSALDTLRLIAGSGIRRSRCRAEFLEELAKGSGLSELDKDVADKLKIITGKEGVDFFRRFVGEEPLGENEEHKIYANPVVFAVGVVDAGRKVLDYYMTWRGKTRAKDLKGHDRKGNLLDEEFRRVARALDRGYRRQARASHDKDDSRSSRSGKPHSSSSSHKHSSVAPNIIVSPPDPVLDTSSPVTPTANRASSANDSVISLPFLGDIRNVPLSNRLPLRVTNPDRNSFTESSAIVEVPATRPTNNNSLETLVEALESAKNAPPDPERQASSDTLVHATDTDQMLEPPKKKKNYAESVSSTGSRSSRSSKSRSHSHKSRRRSSSKKHHESSRSNHKEFDHSSSRHKDKDRDDRHSTRNHRHHHHRSSTHHGERRERDEVDRSSRKSDRTGSSSSRRPLQSNITLVMVDPDEVDKGLLKGVKKDTTKGGSAWHGLAVLPRASKPTPAAVNTPWIGPLARTSDGIRKILPYNLDSDEDEYWEDVPGIPKAKPIIPPPNNEWDSDDSSTSSSFTPPRLPVYPLPGSPHAASTHATPVYPNINPLSPPPGSTYGPQAPVLPYSTVSASQTPYAFTSSNASHHGLSSPMTIPLGLGSPLHASYTPGHIPPPSLTPSTSNNSLHSMTFPPGFIPQHIISPSGMTNASLPSIHAITDPALGHGTNSPYLYSTPRASLGSPYVPAWISPQSSASVSLPGSMTPASARGVPLHSAGYGTSSRGTPPY